MGQNESQCAADDFFVLPDGGHQLIGRRQFAGDIGEARRQTRELQMGGDAAGVLRGGKAELGGKAVRQHHADGNAFAMQQPVGKAGGLFEGMAESVAEIEQRPDPGFLLVGEHEPGFCRAGPGDGFGTGRATGKDFGAVRLEPEEILFVVDETVFDHFAVTGGELAFRQGVEGRKIGKHQLGLVEGTDQILAMRGIDPGLAPDRGIDLRQKRGRHLDEIHAAPGDRRGKARQIANDAAAERNHQIAALEFGGQQGFDDVAEPGKGLAGLPVRYNYGGVFHLGRIERGGEPRQLEFFDLVVGNDTEAAAGKHRLEALAGP